MLARTTSKDLGLSVAIAVVGGAALLWALRGQWNPSDLSPGIEGALTTTVVAFVMVLLHGVGLARAYLINAPLLAILYLACAYGGSPAIGLGVVGMQLVIMAFIGIALVVREPQKAPREAPQRALPQHGRPANAQA
jgi:hypothetical protein